MIRAAMRNLVWALDLLLEAVLPGARADMGRAEAPAGSLVSVDTAPPLLSSAILSATSPGGRGTDGTLDLRADVFIDVFGWRLGISSLFYSEDRCRSFVAERAPTGPDRWGARIGWKGGRYHRDIC